MTAKEAIEQLQDLIKDRESLLNGDTYDDVFKDDITALQAGIKAIETLLEMGGKKPNIVSKVDIKGKLPSLNEYIAACRTNPHVGAKMKQETEELIIIQLGKLKRITSPVIIRFNWHEKNRRRDKDNVAAAKKFIFDAMQKSGKLPNDNNKYIAGFDDRFTYGAAEYGVTITVEVEE